MGCVSSFDPAQLDLLSSVLSFVLPAMLFLFNLSFFEPSSRERGGDLDEAPAGGSLAAFCKVFVDGFSKPAHLRAHNSCLDHTPLWTYVPPTYQF